MMDADDAKDDADAERCPFSKSRTTFVYPCLCSGTKQTFVKRNFCRKECMSASFLGPDACIFFGGSLALSCSLFALFGLVWVVRGLKDIKL